MMERKKRTAEKYFVVRVSVVPADLGAFTALASHKDKAALSRKLFDLVRRNMPGLAEAAITPSGRKAGRQRLRRLYLIPLPEYTDTMAFIRANSSVFSFKNCLKALLLYGKAPETSDNEAFPALPVPLRQESPVAAKKPSPRTLFNESANDIVRAITLDLADWAQNHALENAHFDWLAVSPGEYPEAVRKSVPFCMLREFWTHHHNRT